MSQMAHIGRQRFAQGDPGHSISSMRRAADSFEARRVLPIDDNSLQSEATKSESFFRITSEAMPATRIPLRHAGSPASFIERIELPEAAFPSVPANLLCARMLSAMSWLTIPVFWALCAGAHAYTLSARVVTISDGDTITVVDAHKKQRRIRIAGIEAPEKEQPYGDRSTQHLSDLVYGKSVDIEWRKYDAYGRIFGKIMVAAPNACPAVRPDCPKTLDVGLAQIVAGCAWHYRHYEEEQIPQDRAAYSFAETVARRKHSGLWSDVAPVPPWQWRDEHRKPHQASAKK